MIRTRRARGVRSPRSSSSVTSASADFGYTPHNGETLPSTSSGTTAESGHASLRLTSSERKAEDTKGRSQATTSARSDSHSVRAVSMPANGPNPSRRSGIDGIPSTDSARPINVTELATARADEAMRRRNVRPSSSTRALSEPILALWPPTKTKAWGGFTVSRSRSGLATGEPKLLWYHPRT